MHIDDIVNELLKENTPEFTKWTLNNTNENLKDDDKQYIDVHGVRIITLHIKNQDGTITDFILWIRLTTLKTEVDEIHEFWVQSVLTPSDYQKDKLKKMKIGKVIDIVNEINTTYVPGTLCFINKVEDKKKDNEDKKIIDKDYNEIYKDGYFAYIQKAILPNDNQINYAKTVLMYAVSRGVILAVEALNYKLIGREERNEEREVITNMSTITLNKLVDDYDNEHVYYLDNEETEDNAKFLIWFEKMMDAVCDHNNIVIFDIKDLNISNFMLKKMLTTFADIKKKYPKVTYLFYDSAVIGDMAFGLYKNAIFKEFFKVFTRHEPDKLSDEEFKNLCVRYHEAVTTLIVSMMKKQDEIESNKE